MMERKLEGIYNYRKLSEGIATSGQPTEKELAAIAGAGYQVLINLGLLGTEYALPDEQRMAESLGLAYVHIPVQWEQPTRADLERFAQTMDSHRDKRIWVHCAANMRVSVFMALYRVLSLGWSLEEAMEDVRPLWMPNETWQGFMDDVLRGRKEGEGGHG
jgi:protein tyrosine phosphatase (PTP) superfamily phosphohydrolase (DUF442 family)